MKTLITYSTKTGNTKKVAEAISKAITNSEIMDIADVQNLDYDLIIVGTWIDKGTADAKALKFINGIKDKNTAFFFTLGAYPDSKHAQDCIDNITKLFTDNGNKVLGHYHCQGAIDPKLIEMMRTKFSPDHPHGPTPERIKRWSDASTHPDQNDLDNAYNYLKNFIERF